MKSKAMWRNIKIRLIIPTAFEFLAGIGCWIAFYVTGNKYWLEASAIAFAWASYLVYLMPWRIEK